MHCRKSLLFDNETAWTKKNHSSMFDVTMDSFDGADVCELVGLFLLNNLSEKYGKKKPRTLQRRRAGTSKKRKRTTIRTD